MFPVTRPTAENLIPIRVEVEAEGRVFRDTFCWDAEGLMEDEFS